MHSREQYLERVKEEYRKADKKSKTRLLNEARKRTRLNRKVLSDTDGDPESFIFPTRNGSCIIPTNWAEDVLKPAGVKAGLPHISYHMFRRGHATVQHHGKTAPDKAIQGQMRHSKMSTTQDVYMQQVDPETYQAVVHLEQSLEVNA